MFFKRRAQLTLYAVDVMAVWLAVCTSCSTMLGVMNAAQELAPNQTCTIVGPSCIWGLVLGLFIGGIVLRLIVNSGLCYSLLVGCSAMACVALLLAIEMGMPFSSSLTFAVAWLIAALGLASSHFTVKLASRSGRRIPHLLRVVATLFLIVFVLPGGGVISIALFDPVFRSVNPAYPVLGFVVTGAAAGYLVHVGRLQIQ